MSAPTRTPRRGLSPRTISTPTRWRSSGSSCRTCTCQGSGGFFDFYVPAGRLIIVDRTPFSREWVDSAERGTSQQKQGFPCQTAEGLNVTAGVSIGASVLEANAAKYLYRFGVLPVPGDRSDPKVIFTSVYYSRKLSDVMDDVGRKKVQTLVCNEIVVAPVRQGECRGEPDHAGGAEGRGRLFRRASASRWISSGGPTRSPSTRRCRMR